MYVDCAPASIGAEFLVRSAFSESGSVKQAPVQAVALEESEG